MSCHGNVMSLHVCFLNITLTMFVLCGSVASKLSQYRASRLFWLRIVVIAPVNVAKLNGIFIQTGNHCVLIACGDTWDRSGKQNSVNVTGRTISPTLARLFRKSKGATLLLDALCAVMQATSSPLDGSVCARRNICKWFHFGAISTRLNTSQCVRGWA